MLDIEELSQFTTSTSKGVDEPVATGDKEPLLRTNAITQTHNNTCGFQECL